MNGRQYTANIADNRLMYVNKTPNHDQKSVNCALEQSSNLVRTSKVHMSRKSNHNHSKRSLPDATQLSSPVEVTGAHRKPHVPYAQMRGIIKLFNFYFVNKDKHGRNRRLSREERKSRWKSYKQQVKAEYGKVIKCTLLSEKTNIKRHTDPLTFLKYKLGRAKDLDVNHLAPADKAYFYEIGGIDDLSVLHAQQSNVDSVTAALGPRAKRRRLASSVISDVTMMSTDSSLPNLSQSQDDALTIDSTIPPMLLQPPKLEKNYSDALASLHDDLTVYEREQVQKKRAETKAVFGEKCEVVTNHLRQCLEQHPELIGLLPFPSGDEQIVNAFDYWVSHHVDLIKSKVMTISAFLQRVDAVRADEKEWRLFVRDWKMHRIMHKDDFKVIWDWIVEKLEIVTCNEKEECDDDADIDLTQSE